MARTASSGATQADPLLRPQQPHRDKRVSDALSRQEVCPNALPTITRTSRPFSAQRGSRSAERDKNWVRPFALLAQRTQSCKP